MGLATIIGPSCTDYMKPGISGLQAGGELYGKWQDADNAAEHKDDFGEDYDSYRERIDPSYNDKDEGYNSGYPDGSTPYDGSSDGYWNSDGNYDSGDRSYEEEKDDEPEYGWRLYENPSSYYEGMMEHAREFDEDYNPFHWSI